MPYKLRTILYLDDDANLLFLLKNAVERYMPDATLHVFENLSALLGFLRVSRADLIVTDYMMPDNNLGELLDATAEHDLPVIVASGLSADDIKWPNSDRVIGFLQKPFGRLLAAQYIEDIWKKNQALKASG